MVLLKCCTHYDASKSGKLSSGHRTGKGQFSLQSQRKAMPKNVQTAVQLLLCHMLARLCLKSFKLGFSSKLSKPGFNSTWIVNFQNFKLDLEKVEETEIKLPTSAGSSKKQGNSKKKKTSNSLTMLKSLTVWIMTKCVAVLKKWEY